MSADRQKGVITRLLGVTLIILGVLDSMLAWRGGYAISEMYILLVASGIFVYVIGAVQRGSKS
ncbi:MAG: hypothetical protein ACE5FV_12740 [Woeseia sp.]